MVQGVFSLLVLIAINAFFVFAEYSLAVSRQTRMQELAQAGNMRARWVIQAMQDPDRFFAATQVGVTFTSLAIGVLSEPSFSALLASLLGGFRVLPRPAALALSSIGGLAIASYFQIVLAELIPRALVLRDAERIALIAVPPMHWIAGAFMPFVQLLRGSSRVALRALGVGEAYAGERLHSVQELRMLVEASERGGVLQPEQSDMLNAVFSLGDTTVREVMTPRTEMVGLDADTPLAEVIHIFCSHPYSRLPVYEKDIDHIIGVLHAKDLLPVLQSSTRSFALRQLVREALFVPDTQRADELIVLLRSRRERMAIVLDEYGGTAGLVTLTDLAGRILGDSRIGADEMPDIQLTEDGAVINGLTPIGDVNAEFGLSLSDPHSDTIGGFVMSRLGRIPAVGDEVRLPEVGVCLRVEEMDKRRVARVRLRRLAS